MKKKHRQREIKKLLSESGEIKGVKLGSARVRGTPEYTGMKTKGIALAGKITFDQYSLLVDRGYDGDKIKGWTCNRASKEISKVLGK